MTMLEYERRRRGWNQTDLAYHTRLTQGEISRIENRVFVPSPTYADRLARALGIRSEVLLDEVSEHV